MACCVQLPPVNELDRGHDARHKPFLTPLSVASNVDGASSDSGMCRDSDAEGARSLPPELQRETNAALAAFRNAKARLHSATQPETSCRSRRSPRLLRRPPSHRPRMGDSSDPSSVWPR